MMMPGLLTRLCLGLRPLGIQGAAHPRGGVVRGIPGLTGQIGKRAGGIWSAMTTWTTDLVPAPVALALAVVVALTVVETRRVRRR
jgi:hypothetical protein